MHAPVASHKPTLGLLSQPACKAQVAIPPNSCFLHLIHLHVRKLRLLSRVTPEAGGGGKGEDEGGDGTQIELEPVFLRP